MKLIKYFVGSLIVSFGILLVLAIIVRSMGIDFPQEISRYLPLIWILLAVCIMPFASKIVRVE